MNVKKILLKKSFIFNELKNIDSFFIVERLIFVWFMEKVYIFYSLSVSCCQGLDVLKLKRIL